MTEVQFHYIVLSSLWTEIDVSLPCFKLVLIYFYAHPSTQMLSLVIRR